MILIKIANEVRIGILGLIPLSLYLLALIGISIGFMYIFKQKTTSSRFAIGILVLFGIAYIIPEILIRVVFFPGGDYINYGLGGSIGGIALIGAGSIITAFIASLIYFIWIGKK